MARESSLAKYLKLVNYVDHINLIVLHIYKEGNYVTNFLVSPERAGYLVFTDSLYTTL